MRKMYKAQIQRQCPDCRVDVVGRHGVVITGVDGRRKYVSVRHRIADKMSAMLMLFSVVLMTAYGIL